MNSNLQSLSAVSSGDNSVTIILYWVSVATVSWMYLCQKIICSSGEIKSKAALTVLGKVKQNYCILVKDVKINLKNIYIL